MGSKVRSMLEVAYRDRVVAGYKIGMLGSSGAFPGLTIARLGLVQPVAICLDPLRALGRRGW